MAASLATPELPFDIREDLILIGKHLWRAGSPYRPNLGGNPIPTLVPNRNLTEGEFLRIIGAIREHQLILTIHSGEIGFGFGFNVLAHPDVGEKEPVHLCSFEARQIPSSVMEKVYPHKEPVDHRDRVFKYLVEGFICVEPNIGFIRFYKLGEPEERSRYEY